MTSPQGHKPQVKLKIEPEKYAVIGNIAFLIGEFVFVAGSSIGLAAALHALKSKQKGDSPTTGTEAVTNINP